MIMIDQRKRTAKDNAHKTAKGVLMGFILAVALIAALSEIREPKAAVLANSVVGATFDNLMSTERAEYMVLFEHGQTFEEWDMQ